MTSIDKIVMIFTIAFTSTFVGIALFGYSGGNWPKFVMETDDNGLKTIISVIGSVIGSIGASIVGIWYAIRILAKRSMKSAINELEKRLVKGRKVKYVFTNGEELHYINDIITTTPFDSIVSSGAFRHFSTKLQIMLDNMYFQVVHRNKLIHEIGAIHDQIRITTPSGTYQRILGKCRITVL